MANLSITPGNVIANPNSSVTNGTAGQTITAGQTVYLSTSTGQYLLANSNNVNTATLAGIALNNCSANQPIQVLNAGDIVIGATVVVGETYILSAVPTAGGGISPVGDVMTGGTEYVDFIGIGTSTTDIFVQILNSGTTHS